MCPLCPLESWASQQNLLHLQTLGQLSSSPYCSNENIVPSELPVLPGALSSRLLSVLHIWYHQTWRRRVIIISTHGISLLHKPVSHHDLNFNILFSDHLLATPKILRPHKIHSPLNHMLFQYSPSILCPNFSPHLVCITWPIIIVIPLYLSSTPLSPPSSVVLA